jgi:aryl-alcohol dehydrogenase-like predicted oxidoreductase
MLDAEISSTGIRVSRFGYGTGSLHRTFSTRERRNLLHAAADLGFTHFDTSPYYGFGLSEIDLGTLLRGRRSRFTVTTKVGIYARGPAARHVSDVWIRKAVGRVMPAVSLPVASFDVERARHSLDHSLKRLGTDQVDFLFLHEPDATKLHADDILAWLVAERKAGRVHAWGIAGVSHHIAPHLADRSPLAVVVQTNDSLDGQEADVVIRASRPLDFTYGYFSPTSKAGMRLAASPAAVLERNATGCILVSSCRINRLKMLAEAAA